MAEMSAYNYVDPDYPSDEPVLPFDSQIAVIEAHSISTRKKMDRLNGFNKAILFWCTANTTINAITLGVLIGRTITHWNS